MKTSGFWKYALVAVVAILWNVAAASAATYTNYVSLSGSDGNGGTSWAEAYATVTNALAQANSQIGAGASDAQIYVDTGIYTQSVELVVTQAIAIIGKGGVGVDDGSQSIIRQTNLLRRVCTLSNANARLVGLVVENGQSGQGGNVSMGAGCVTNCVIRGNRLIGKPGGTAAVWAKGGGINMSGGLITDSVVSSNVVNGAYYGPYSTYMSYGGGVYLTGGTLRRTRVFGNTAYSQLGYNVPVYGGGVHIDGANAVVENCLILSNQVYAATLDAVFAGGGVYLKAGTLRNCTIIANTNSVTTNQNWGAGLRQTGGTAVNCIVWGNVMTNTPSDYSSNSVQNVTYSCAPELTGGEGNKTNDPLFTDPSSGDYHLLLASPCVNAGTNQPDWMATATDFDGHPRILGGTVDMGAYELIPLRGTMIMMQ